MRGGQSKLPGRRYGCNRSLSSRSLLVAGGGAGGAADPGPDARGGEVVAGGALLLPRRERGSDGVGAQTGAASAARGGEPGDKGDATERHEYVPQPRPDRVDVHAR